MSRECPKKPNKPPPYTKAQTAATQPTSTIAEATTSQTETDKEKVNRLVAELKGLNDDVQDLVLNKAFIGKEDF